MKLLKATLNRLQIRKKIRTNTPESAADLLPSQSDKAQMMKIRNISPPIRKSEGIPKRGRNIPNSGVPILVWHEWICPISGGTFRAGVAEMRANVADLRTAPIEGAKNKPRMLTHSEVEALRQDLKRTIELLRSGRTS